MSDDLGHIDTFNENKDESRIWLKEKLCLGLQKYPVHYFIP